MTSINNSLSVGTAFPIGEPKSGKVSSALFDLNVEDISMNSPPGTYLASGEGLGKALNDFVTTNSLTPGVSETLHSTYPKSVTLTQTLEGTPIDKAITKQPSIKNIKDTLLKNRLTGLASLAKMHKIQVDRHSSVQMSTTPLVLAFAVKILLERMENILPVGKQLSDDNIVIDCGHEGLLMALALAKGKNQLIIPSFINSDSNQKGALSAGFFPSLLQEMLGGDRAGAAVLPLSENGSIRKVYRDIATECGIPESAQEGMNPLFDRLFSSHLHKYHSNYAAFQPSPLSTETEALMASKEGQSTIKAFADQLKKLHSELNDAFNDPSIHSAQKQSLEKSFLYIEGAIASHNKQVLEQDENPSYVLVVNTHDSPITQSKDLVEQYLPSDQNYHISPKGPFVNGRDTAFMSLNMDESDSPLHMINRVGDELRVNGVELKENHHFKEVNAICKQIFGHHLFDVEALEKKHIVPSFSSTVPGSTVYSQRPLVEISMPTSKEENRVPGGGKAKTIIKLNGNSAIMQGATYSDLHSVSNLALDRR